MADSLVLLVQHDYIPLLVLHVCSFLAVLDSYAHCRRVISPLYLCTPPRERTRHVKHLHARFLPREMGQIWSTVGGPGVVGPFD